MDEMVWAPDFAEEKGINLRRLRRWCDEGEVLGAMKEARAGSIQPVWRAPRSSWEAAAAKERKPGPKLGSKRSPGPTPQ